MWWIGDVKSGGGTLELEIQRFLYQAHSVTWAGEGFLGRAVCDAERLPLERFSWKTIVFL